MKIVLLWYGQHCVVCLETEFPSFCPELTFFWLQADNIRLLIFLILHPPPPPPACPPSLSLSLSLSPVIKRSLTTAKALDTLLLYMHTMYTTI